MEARPRWQTWWQLTRPHTLTAAFVPVFIGTTLALPLTEINIPLLVAVLVAALLIQTATNMFNEFYDFKRGLDTEHSVGIGGAIVRDGVKPKTVLSIAFALYGIALLIGIYICMNTTWWLAVIGIVSMMVGYLYTGGPYPIAYTPFGEIVSGFFMGCLIILISFYLQTGYITTTSILVSIPIFFLVGAILLSNNIRDLEGDKKNGRKTLAILLGPIGAIYLLAGMFIAAYTWTLGLIILKIVSPWILIVLLSIPKAVSAVKLFIGKTEPIEMMPAMRSTAQTNTIFGFLLAIGLILGHLF